MAIAQWETQERVVRILRNIGYETWCIEEQWAPFTVRSPFSTREKAIQRAKDIAVAYGYKVRIE